MVRQSFFPGAIFLHGIDFRVSILRKRDREAAPVAVPVGSRVQPRVAADDAHPSRSLIHAVEVRVLVLVAGKGEPFALHAPHG